MCYERFWVKSMELCYGFRGCLFILFAISAGSYLRYYFKFGIKFSISTSFTKLLSVFIIAVPDLLITVNST